MAEDLWYPRKMPRRFKALAALLLAIVVCLVLVLPQVDLDDGVLRDVQTQVSVLMLMGLAAACVLCLPSGLARSLRELLVEESIALYAKERSIFSWRC